MAVRFAVLVRNKEFIDPIVMEIIEKGGICEGFSVNLMDKASGGGCMWNTKLVVL